MSDERARSAYWPHKRTPPWARALASAVLTCALFDARKGDTKARAWLTQERGERFVLFCEVLDLTPGVCAKRFATILASSKDVVRIARKARKGGRDVRRTADV